MDEGPLTFAEMSKRFGKSVSWWRGKAKDGAIRTVPFGGAQAVPPEEVARFRNEGLGPLHRRVRKAAEGAA